MKEENKVGGSDRMGVSWQRAEARMCAAARTIERSMYCAVHVPVHYWWSMHERRASMESPKPEEEHDAGRSIARARCPPPAGTAHMRCHCHADAKRRRHRIDRSPAPLHGASTTRARSYQGQGRPAGRTRRMHAGARALCYELRTGRGQTQLYSFYPCDAKGNRKAS
jgi:hypothetical protein